MATIEGGRSALAGMAERGDVLDAVDRLLQQAAEGHGGALYVEGPAGLGKTTLLGCAMSTAGSWFGIGVGRGDQVESVLPFGLICQALRQIPGAWSSASCIAAAGDSPIPGRGQPVLHSRVSREVPVETVDHALAVCAGNPLLIEQVALELSQSGRIPNGSGLVRSLQRRHCTR